MGEAVLRSSGVGVKLGLPTTVTATDKPTDVEGLLAARTFDLVLTDLKMEPIGGMDVLRRCKETDPNLQVLMITAFATV